MFTYLHVPPYPLPPFSPSLISLTVSVDAKHHIYAPCALLCSINILKSPPPPHTHTHTHTHTPLPCLLGLDARDASGVVDASAQLRVFVVAGCVLQTLVQSPRQRREYAARQDHSGSAHAVGSPSLQRRVVVSAMAARLRQTAYKLSLITST